MATTVVPTQDRADQSRLPADSATRRRQKVGPVKRLLMPLASLKLTVALFAIGIFIVLAGTLAQAEMGIERVVNEFFRVRPWGSTFGFAWIPFQIFFPESFFGSGGPQVGGGFWFPGGWLIGGLMFVNLLAAHAVRFTVQARGARLLAGLGVILMGIGLTAAVVASGSGVTGLQAVPILDWTILWRLFQGHLVLFALFNLGIAAWLYTKPEADRRFVWMAIAATPITVALATWALLIPGVSDSSMRILWQLIKASMAALVLLGGCWMVFRKRAGIVLLHAGVGLLMISELLVGLQAVETMMALREGETTSWAQDIRTVELAVVDPSPAEHDALTRFPASRLAAGAKLSHESIPFQIQVDQYFGNAVLTDAPVGGKNAADSGYSKRWIATEAAEVAGVSTDAGVDTPAAYVTLFDADGDKRLGSYLLSAELSRPETIKVDGKEWRVDLRFKRDYKPYSVTLLDIRKDNYVGTDVVKNYSSDVRVESGELEPFERHIWMNNPMRFSGETLYQSQYLGADRSGREGSVFQVVKNTGWMLPYVACMIVAIGMAAQFLVTLSRFVGRRASAAATSTSAVGTAATERNKYGWVVPAIVTLIFAAWLGSKFAPPRVKAGEPNLVAFAELPVTSHGRVKPIDTVARDALKALSNNRQQFKTGETYGPFDMFDRKESAIRWLMEFIANPQTGAQRRVVRIDNGELISILQLPEGRDDFLFSIAEVSKTVPALAKRMQEVDDKRQREESLDATDRAAQDLERKIGVIDLLLASFQPNRDVIQGGIPALRDYMQRYRVMKLGDDSVSPAIPSRNPPLAVFYKNIGAQERDWETLGHAQLVEGLLQWAASQTGETHEIDPTVAAWTDMIDAWNKEDTAGFNAAVMRYRTSIEKDPPKNYVPGKVDFEAYFNHAAPFYYLMIPYVFAALLAACSWMGLNRPLNRTAFWLVVMTFVFHTLALAGRIYISGRPPVTNLYSSAVFIGWGAVAFGIAIECLYRLGFGNVMAGVVGFATLLIAHNLSGDGTDTFSVLQAVLDTQFWLATHVVTVTMGYAATYVAGFLGLLYVILGLTTGKLNRRLDEDGESSARLTGRDQTVAKALIRSLYGVLCFAILFSFFGTVLGGLWADDSWGRFWGWDPKENGALIIVLWNALVLHARWGGIVKDRGLALLAVLGNITVSWSWFGTNELGVGLHSYGFTDGVILALGLFVFSQLAVVAAGLLPLHMWRSFRNEPDSATA